jgi:Ohr subfamily peroxiredoxin
MKVLDTISATNVGGRNGKGKSSDGKVEIQFSLAKALGGKGEGATPEHMFALGYSACFASALQYVAGLQKVHTSPDLSLTAKIDLCQTDDNKFQLAVELTVKDPSIDKAKLEELVKVAHTVCPYSRAIHGNVDVKLSVA